MDGVGILRYSGAARRFCARPVVRRCDRRGKGTVECDVHGRLEPHRRGHEYRFLRYTDDGRILAVSEKKDAKTRV